MASTPQGITPPSPGQHKEEPDLWQEDDIPSQDKPGADDQREEREGDEGEVRDQEPERGERGG